MAKPSPEVDTVVLGTGVAPLVAALLLRSNGKRVVVLNPNHDFFLENSELPLDPIMTIVSGAHRSVKSIEMSDPEMVLHELRPEFPGAVEYAPMETTENSSGFSDPTAPYVRSRSRLWMKPIRNPSSKKIQRFWDRVEEYYVEASDRGWSSRVLDGILACNRFPGFNGEVRDDYRGILIPKLSDVDVDRYRIGLLEFARERLGAENVICGVENLELLSQSIRFYVDNQQHAIDMESVMSFWTPEMSSWVQGRLRMRQKEDKLIPTGIRIWEQWVLASKEKLDPGTVGVLEDMVVWAEVEGSPLATKDLKRLTVLREGPLVQEKSQGNWASGESFESLTYLCQEFLKWGHYSVLSMQPRAIFEWKKDQVLNIGTEDLPHLIIAGCDGPLMKVVRLARDAAEELS